MELTLTVRSRLLMLMGMIVIFLLFQLLLFNQLHLLAPASTIAPGYLHTCAVLDNASVKCWGYNNYGQLGIDSTTTIGDSSGEMASLSAVNLGTGRTATALASGIYHGCALLDNASVKCWGYNNYGQLGIDSTATMGDNSGEMASLSTVNLGTGRTATAITSLLYYTCALLDGGDVKCWGHNNYGQLGIDSTVNTGDNSDEMASISELT